MDAAPNDIEEPTDPGLAGFASLDTILLSFHTGDLAWLAGVLRSTLEELRTLPGQARERMEELEALIQKREVLEAALRELHTRLTLVVTLVLEAAPEWKAASWIADAQAQLTKAAEVLSRP